MRVKFELILLEHYSPIQNSKMMNIPTASYLKEDADDFLDRVDEVNKQIRDLIDGKIDCEELDKKENELKEKERLKQV
jgi:hypothetical protein